MPRHADFSIEVSGQVLGLAIILALIFASVLVNTVTVYGRVTMIFQVESYSHTISLLSITDNPLSFLAGFGQSKNTIQLTQLSNSTTSPPAYYNLGFKVLSGYGTSQQIVAANSWNSIRTGIYQMSLVVNLQSQQYFVNATATFLDGSPPATMEVVVPAA